jgi:hypothetical protein
MKCKQKKTKGTDVMIASTVIKEGATHCTPLSMISRH